MKLNRLLSAAVAACMSLTMFAGAVSLDAAANEAESETLTGSVVHVTADGNFTSTFEYTVPADATDEEEDLIFLQAAEEAAGVAPRGRGYSHLYSILTKSNVSIPGKVKADTKLTQNGGMLEVLVSGLSCTGELGVAYDSRGMVDTIRDGSAGVCFVYDADYCDITAGTYPVFTLYTYEASTASRVRAYHHY